LGSYLANTELKLQATLEKWSRHMLALFVFIRCKASLEPWLYTHSDQSSVAPAVPRTWNPVYPTPYYIEKATATFEPACPMKQLEEEVKYSE
jgi:hypothetical protein